MTRRVGYPSLRDGFSLMVLQEGFAMARVADHLSISDLEQRFRSCKDPLEARHVQAIWLLAQGHTVGSTSKVTAFGQRWIEQLLERYNTSDPEALANVRRRSGLEPTSA